MCLFEINSRV